MALTPREAEVLAAVARHRTNAEIAAELFISVRTVESHVSSLLRKLDVADRRALADRAATTAVAVDDRAGLVGREDDLARLQELLAPPGLVTVLGPGGVGKTTLVRSLRDAVVVDLARLPAESGAGFVAGAALDALGGEVPDGRSVAEALAATAARRAAPVVLDCCEHVLDAAAYVAGLLVRTGVRVAATSRERLGVTGERLLPLPPLTAGHARELFLRRAAELQPPVLVPDDQYSVVDAVCEAVDYLPFAVELAAARLGQLALPDLADAVSTGIDVLEGGDRSRTRHRSVRAMLDWSYALLPSEDRHVHRHLSVLVGPFRIAVATAVTGDGATVAPSVARLVEASLLVRVGPDRYRQLELVRRHAGEALTAEGEREAAEAALLAWAAAYVADGSGPDESPDLRAAAELVRRAPEQDVSLLRDLAVHWADRGADLDATEMWQRAARASGSPGDALAAAELAMARWRGPEAWRLFALAADLAEAAGTGASLVRALEAQIELGARFPATMRDVPGSAVLRELCDRALAADTEDDLVSEALLACAQAWTAAAAGDLAGARDSARRAVAMADAAGDAVTASIAWDALSGAAYDDGDAEAVDEIAERRMSLRGRLAGSPRAELERSDVDTMAVDGALAVGRFDAARTRAEELLARETERGLAHVGLGRLVSAEFHLGRFDDALAHAGDAVEAWEAYGSGPAGYLVAPIAACVAICGYRESDDRSWLLLLDRLSPRATTSPLLRALRADVHLFHGRLDQAAAEVSESPRDVPGPHRSSYAAVRAAALGGDTLDEAQLLVRGNRAAAGVLARARGELQTAVETFLECGAAFEVARTRALQQPGDPEVLAALDQFLRG